MIAEQYAPPSNATAADAVYARIYRPPTKPARQLTEEEEADANSLSTGMPRGAHLYSQMGDNNSHLRSFDGRPSPRHEPPKRARKESVGVVANCVLHRK